MADNSLNVSNKLDKILQYLEDNDSKVKNIDESEVESIFDSLTDEGNDSVSTDDFVDLFTEYYVDEDNSSDISEINEQFMSAFSDIASIDGNSEEFSRDEFDIFTKAIKNSNEYNDLGYADDERIKTDIYGNHYISAEKWENDSSVNGCLYNIIKNSYNFDELDISFSDAYSVLLSAIAEKNGISDVNLIYENQEILLVDPYEALGIEKPNAEDIVVEVPVETKSPSDDEGSDVGDDSDPVVDTEPVDDTDDKSKTLNAALSDIYAELEKRKSETETEAESKTGFGAAWNAIKGVFGSGTKGELSEIEELEELYESVSEDPSEDAVKELYETVFGTELNLETVSAGSEISEELTNGSYSINGTEISTEDVVNALEDQVAALDDSFSENVDSQGVISKGISWLNNNLLGIGTTKNMTQAQIDELSEQVEKLKNASDSDEFAAVYKSITGEDLSSKSLETLFENETSKLEDTTAAESMIDYENATDNIKNTVIAVGVGVATAATGGIAGAVALGVGATVAVNAIDAGTQDNGQNVGENLLEYAQTDMVKDACVGAINGLTGKLGNMAGEKLVSTFAAKKLGTTAAAELVETTMEEGAAKGLSIAAQQSAANTALKGTLSTGTRIVTEFADGALDAGLSSAGEYVLDAAAGENGNFTSSDGSLIDENGNLALFDNFNENFDAVEMAEQVAVSTLMGGVMSAGMQEGIGAVTNKLSSAKNAASVDSETPLLSYDETHYDYYVTSYTDADTGIKYIWDETSNSWKADEAVSMSSAASQADDAVNTNLLTDNIESDVEVKNEITDTASESSSPEYTNLSSDGETVSEDISESLQRIESVQEGAGNAINEGSEVTPAQIESMPDGVVAMDNAADSSVKTENAAGEESIKAADEEIKPSNSSKADVKKAKSELALEEIAGMSVEERAQLLQGKGFDVETATKIASLEEYKYQKAVELADKGVWLRDIAEIASLDGNKYQRAVELADKGVDSRYIAKIASLEGDKYQNALDLIDKGIYSWDIAEIASLEGDKYQNALDLIDKGIDSLNIAKIASLEGNKYQRAVELADKGVESRSIADMASLDDTQYEKALELLSYNVPGYDVVKNAKLEGSAYKKELDKVKAISSGLKNEVAADSLSSKSELPIVTDEMKKNIVKKLKSQNVSVSDEDSVGTIAERWKQKYITGINALDNEETSIIMPYAMKQYESPNGQPLARWMYIDSDGISDISLEDFIETFPDVGETYYPNRMQSFAKTIYGAERTCGNNFSDSNTAKNVKFVVYPKNEITQAFDAGKGRYGSDEAIYSPKQGYRVLYKTIEQRQIILPVSEYEKVNRNWENLGYTQNGSEYVKKYDFFTVYMQEE